MLHAKFQDHRTSAYREEDLKNSIYGRGGHLGHVTWTIYIKVCLNPKEATHKIWH